MDPTPEYCMKTSNDFGSNLHRRTQRKENRLFGIQLEIETDLKVLNETWDFCLESLIKEFYMFSGWYIDFKITKVFLFMFELIFYEQLLSYMESAL